jgi:hypothetical protein
MVRIARGALVGLLFGLVVGMWPADASPTGVSVTSPAQNAVIAGSYDADGTGSGFSVNVRGTARTGCSSFSKITFKVTGPNSYSYSPSSWTFAYGGSSYSGGPSTPWNTENLRNGVYTTTIYATDQGTLCNSQTGSAYTTAKLANPPATPQWDGSPTAASDGSANVTLSFKKNPEYDVIEYHIFREGPDGTKLAIVSATNPGDSGCTFSQGSYTCVDPASNFPANYDGTYTYAVNAWRSRPAYGSGEEEKLCSTNNSPCVVSRAGDAREVTLTAPTPTPSPSSSPSPGGGTPTLGTHSPTPGGGNTPGNKKGTSVLSFGSSTSRSYNEFYSGTYSENLPYQPKTLIVGGQGSRTPSTKTYEAASLSDGPPNYRTIMLPVAGGLLAFLSAAHVRRLLIHF